MTPATWHDHARRAHARQLLRDRRAGTWLFILLAIEYVGRWLGR